MKLVSSISKKIGLPSFRVTNEVEIVLNTYVIEKSYNSATYEFELIINGWKGEGSTIETIDISVTPKVADIMISEYTLNNLVYKSGGEYMGGTSWVQTAEYNHDPAFRPAAKWYFGLTSLKIHGTSYDPPAMYSEQNYGPSSMLYPKIDDAYRYGYPYIKLDGEWVPSDKAYVKVGGEWRANA